MACTWKEKIAQIGAGRSFQNPNDPRICGAYENPVEKLSPERRSVHQDFPLEPAKSPFGSLR